jgi:molybdopterin-guanine dinucleotide biosynthesis protein A
MGRDKARLELDGATLLDRALGVLGQVCDAVIVVARPDQRIPPLPSGVRLVHDRMRGAGPLGGLEAALGASDGELVAVLAVDMPMARPTVIARLAALAAERPDADVVTVRSPHGWEPLHAVYRRRAIADARRHLERGDLALASLLDDLVVVELPDDEWRSLDPDRASATNVNTPADLAALPG